MNNLKIGLVGVTQANFAGGAAGTGGKEKLFKDGVAGIKALAAELRVNLYAYPKLLINDADTMEACAVLEGEKVDFLLVHVTTFAAGEIIIRLAKHFPRLGIWALPEPATEGSVFFDSINSFCGLNMYGGILSHYLKDEGIQYKWFYGNAEDARLLRRLTVTVRALSAVKKMRGAKVGLLGGIAPGFNDLYFDERIAQKRLGLNIQRNHEFSEIKQRAQAYTEAELADAKAEALSGYTNCAAMSAECLEMHARFYKAYRDFCRDGGYDALAISCWPKMQEEMNSLSCSIIGKLNQNGIPAACEGDLPGAVSMLMQKYIAEQPTTLMDLSGIDESNHSVLMWHCGPSPECYADAKGACLCVSRQPAGEGKISQRGMVIDMVFMPQPVTFMRITGEWDRMFLLNGDVLENQKPSLDGSRGWVGNLRLNRRPIDVMDLVNTILVHGMQHHYPMIAGDIAEELLEAAAWLGIAPLEAIPYENYLQTH